MAPPKKLPTIAVDHAIHADMQTYAEQYGITLTDLVARMWRLWHDQDPARESGMFPSPLYEASELSPEQQPYAAAYGILRGYFEIVLTSFVEVFSADQLAEIRIVLDQLTQLVGEDYHLDDATKGKLDQLAQALRESE